MNNAIPDNISIGEFVKNGAEFKEGFSNFAPSFNFADGSSKYNNYIGGVVLDGAVKSVEISKAAEAKKAADKDAAANKFFLSKANKLRMGLWALGSVSGIVLAVHRKSGFWGGVGWWIVGGMAGGAIGWVVTSVMDEEK